MSRKDQLNTRYIVYIEKEYYVNNSETGEKERINLKFPSEMSETDIIDVLEDQTCYNTIINARDGQTSIKISQRSKDTRL